MPQPLTVQALLRQGISAAKAGQVEQARQALMRVVEFDETNVQAWLWLSAVVDDPTDKFTCLHNALGIEPGNKHAQLGLARLEEQYGIKPSAPPVPTAPLSSLPPPPPQIIEPSPNLPPPVAAPLNVRSPDCNLDSVDSSTPLPSPEPIPTKPARAERTGSGQYKRLAPTDAPPKPTAPRPGHLQEHASVAAALFKDDFAARRKQEPPPLAEPMPAELPLEFIPEPDDLSPPPPRPGPLRKLARVLIILVALLLCAPCSLLGGFQILAELNLRWNGQVVEASVTDYASTRDEQGVIRQEVQYKFSLDGTTWYAYNGSDNIRHPAWASLTPADWEAARKTKQVKVLYVPTMPSINRPLNLSEQSDPFKWPGRTLAIGLGVGLVVGIGGLSLSMFVGRGKDPAQIEPVVVKRYKRTLNKNEAVSTSAPGDQPKHRQAYASMAGALIQSKSPAKTSLVNDSKSGIKQDFEQSPEIILSEDLPAPRADGPICPFCRRPISAMASLCETCQLPLVVNCPACKARVDVEYPTCPECGEALGNYRHKTVYFAGLAQAYYEHQQHRQAIETWQVVQKLNPNYPQLRLHLAEAQAGMGRSQAAIAILRQVLTEDPGQEAACLILGKIYHHLSYWDEAEAVYKEALAMSPQSAELHFALGWLLADHGQLKGGLPYIREATQLDPKHGLAWFRLGQLHQALGQPKPAAAAYRQAVTLLPEDSLAHQQAVKLVGVVMPELPKVLDAGWLEFIRQVTGPALLCVLTVLLDSGMRPWWIPLTGWLALLLGLVGAFLWVSGANLPRNPMICWLAGERGLFTHEARVTATVLGVGCWLLAMAMILYPIGQSVPEVPSWIRSL